MNSDYTYYTAVDFIADEYFQQWAKYPDGESNAFWQDWVVRNPAKETEIRSALAFINNLQFKTIEPAEQQVEFSLQKNLAGIEQLEQEASSKQRKNAVRQMLFKWVAAASVLICCGLAAWYYFGQKPVTFEMATGNGEIKTLVLPDSSVVVLNANSSISYPLNMASQSTREVWLEGEGFFTVKHIEPAKQSPHRFIVHTGDLNIEVLGTTFNVNKRAAVTNVSLNTGKIKIDIKDYPESAIILQPGDFIQYAAEKKHILRKKVEAALYSVWKDEKVVLVEMPLSAIAQLIEDAYGYQVTITDKKLAMSKVSGSLYMKDEATMLKALAFVLDLNISKHDNLLIFQPKQKLKTDL